MNHNKSGIMCTYRIILLLVLLMGRALSFHPQHYPAVSMKYKRSCAKVSSAKSSDDIIASIDAPLLEQLYPKLVEHKEKYGNCNIPLGSKDGRACYSLRRMHVQSKLSEHDVELLKNIGFRFTFDDIFPDMDFDEMLGKLLKYNEENPEVEAFQIPKKYKPDPELGAWVTAVRRIGREKIGEKEREKLDSVGFAWISTRKCGSKFMAGYRDLKEHFIDTLHNQSSRHELSMICRNESGNIINVDQIVQFISKEYTSKEDHDNFQSLWKEILVDNIDLKKWVLTQKETHSKGKLSEARVNYMEELQVIGLHWQGDLFL